MGLVSFSLSSPVTVQQFSHHCVPFDNVSCIRSCSMYVVRPSPLMFFSIWLSFYGDRLIGWLWLEGVFFTFLFCSRVRIPNTYINPIAGRSRLHATLLRKACFEEFRGKVLLGVVDELYGKVSQVQCQKACAVSLLRNSVLCKAAIYYPKEQVVFFSFQSTSH